MKKLFVSVLASIFAVGMLTACGEVEEEPINDPGLEEDGDLDNFDDEQDETVEGEEDDDETDEDDI